MRQLQRSQWFRQRWMPIALLSLLLLSLLVGVQFARAAGPDLQISTSNGVTTVQPGQVRTYTVTIENIGNDAAINVVARDTLPSGVTFLGASDGGAFSGGSVTWNIGAIADQSQAPLNMAYRYVTVRIDNPWTGGATLTNTANVSYDSATATGFTGSSTEDDAVAAASITGVAFNDLNTDGLLTSGEPGLAGIAVNATWAGPDGVLGNSNDVNYTPATTDSNGAYSFTGLPEGRYRVTVGAKTGYNVTTTNPLNINLAQAQSYTGADFGFRRLNADLAVTKTVDVARPNVGDTVTFTISVRNNGPDAATNVQLTDQLPAGLTFSSASVGAYDSATGVWTIGAIANQGSATLTLAATVDVGAAGQTVTNTTGALNADQADPDATNNSASASVIVQSADLQVTKTVDQAQPIAGDTVTFTISVRNNGPDAATNARLTDALPSGLTFVDAMPSSGAYDSATGVWTIGTLAKDATATLTLKAAVDYGAGGQTITNTTSGLQADQADPNTQNNVGTASITVQRAADLAVTKTVDVADPKPGDTVTFTIRVRDFGPDTANNVRVTDQLPSGLTFVDATPSDGTYDPATGVWTIGIVSVESRTTLVLRATVNPGTAGQTITNTTSNLAADELDPDSANNVGQASISVVGADLGVTKTVDQSQPNEGDTVTFTISVRNNGPSDATGVQLTDDLPFGLSFVSAKPSSGAYDSATGVWTIGAIANQGSATLTLKATVAGETAGQTITNTTSNLTATEPDPNTQNNVGTASVTVQAADLGVTKSVDKARPDVGGTIAYTILVHNYGPTGATNARLTDVLPSGVTYVDSTASVGAYDSTTGVWSIGTLAKDANALLTIRAKVNVGTAGQTITNTTSDLTADQRDPDSDNNADSADIVPQAVNTPPNVKDDAVNTPEDTAITIDVLANDSDVDGLMDRTSVQLRTLPNSGTAVVNSNGTIMYTPAPNFTGTVSFAYKACDQGTPLPVKCGQALVTVTVDPRNDPPTPGDDSLSTIKNKALPIPAATLLRNDTDPDGDALTITAAGPNTTRGGSVSMSGTDLLYTPPTDFVGNDSFTYTVSDGKGGTAAATVTIDVQLMYQTYLPIVVGGQSAPVQQPDLQGSFTLSPNKTSFAPGEPVQITVQVTNKSNVASGPFWVDFYLNPSTPPTKANMAWNTNCGLTPCYGIAWYVEGGLGPNQTITLSSTAGSYTTGSTIWPGYFARGTTDAYLYVDSWNPGNDDGAVAESNETNNRAELHNLVVSGNSVAAPVDLPNAADLPPRPRR